MYYEKGLEKPYKEFQLLPQCRISDLKLESYGEPRKVSRTQKRNASTLSWRLVISQR